MDMKTVDMLATILVFIGAINWGLFGLANMNLVALVFGTVPLLATAVYILVALSGILVLYARFVRK